MLASDYRRLGLVINTDYTSLNSVSGAIQSGINNSLQISTGWSTFSGAILTGTSGIYETEWPKPCEYFGGTLYASEVSTLPDNYDQFGNVLPLYQKSGIEDYNMLQSITGLNNSGLFPTNYFDNQNYILWVTSKNISGNIMNMYGRVYANTPLDYVITGVSNSYIYPTVTMTSGFKKFSFDRFMFGYIYQIEYATGQSSNIWFQTGINLTRSTNQSGVSGSFVREEFSKTSGDIYSYRLNGTPCQILLTGKFSVESSGQIQLIKVILNDSENTFYNLWSTGNNIGILSKDVHYYYTCK